MRACFGAFAEGIAGGLKLRHDHGSQFVADDYQRELAFLGIASSPAFVREPEGNGCVERFIRTLKENLLWVRRFATIEELRLALHAFKDTYNQTWIVERHGYQTPAAVRAASQAEATSRACSFWYISGYSRVGRDPTRHHALQDEHAAGGPFQTEQMDQREGHDRRHGEMEAARDRRPATAPRSARLQAAWPSVSSISGIASPPKMVKASSTGVGRRVSAAISTIAIPTA